MGKGKNRRKKEGEILLKQMVGSIIIGFLGIVCIILLLVVAKG